MRRPGYAALAVATRISPEPNTGCWLWVGVVDRHGYGRVLKAGVATHRVAWEANYGPVPPGACVLHRCDQRSCVNPAHLFIGSVADNNADMMRKGRFRAPPTAFRSGPLHPRWKGGSRSTLARHRCAEGGRP